MKEGNQQPLKVIVFGETGVGKSALAVRYVMRQFQGTYEPTIEDSYPTNVEVDGRSVNMELMDTAGHGVFSQMRDSYIRSGDGFVLVYSVTEPWTLHAMTAIRDQILTLKGEKARIKPITPIVLVGNKCDLEDERQLTYQEGERVARKFMCPFFETSAKDDIGIDDVFVEMTRKIKRSKMGTSRNTFSRDSRARFSLRGLTISERKCKERLQALKGSEKHSEFRRTGSFRRFLCGVGTLPH